MIGHIAYSLYKSNKIEFIRQFESENDRPPDEGELDAFHKSSKTSLPALRIQARTILGNFIKITTGQYIKSIEQQVWARQETILKGIVDPIIPKQKGHWDGFWMSVIVKGAQTIVVAFFLFLLIFAASAKKDLWGAIRNLIPESQSSSSDANMTNH